MIAYIVSIAVVSGANGLDYKAKTKEIRMAQVASAASLGCLAEDVEVSDFRRAKAPRSGQVLSWHASCRQENMMCGAMFSGDGVGNSLGCRALSRETLAKLDPAQAKMMQPKQVVAAKAAPAKKAPIKAVPAKPESKGTVATKASTVPPVPTNK